MKNTRKQFYWFIVCVAIILFSVIMAALIQSDFGKVEVSIVKIETFQGETLVAKLFRPKIATAENPLPAVINMHGYQNDKSVQDPASIELARRGFVVIAPDALGHGDSQGGVSWAGGDNVMGNADALAYLISLPFVDAEHIGAMGHSMGGMNAVQLPALFPENVKALAQQASLPGAPALPNVLILQARYEEFQGFREMQFLTDDLTSSETRLAALGITDPVEWNTTYGNFDDGTARRMEYINMDHHLLPLMNQTNAAIVDWFRMALKDGQGGSMWIEPTKQIYMIKEWFGFLALLTTLVSLLPLTNLLLATTFFKPVAQPMPNRYFPTKKTWWVLATINLLIGGILYPLTTMYGGIGGKIETWLPFMKLEMGNGVAAFFFANAVVAFILFLIWYRGAKKKGVTMYDMGVSFDENKTVIDWKIIGKTALLGGILFMWMYLLAAFCQSTLGMEIRFAWPYMREFGQPNRIGYFFLYLIPGLLFFLVNGGIFLFGQARLKEYATPAKTQWMWWLKALYAMVTGFFLVWVFQYLPWVLGAGPGFEVTGITDKIIPAIGTSMWPLMLFVYIPEFIIIYWFLTWFFRKTGKIYLGALVMASVVTWFLAAGSVLLR